MRIAFFSDAYHPRVSGQVFSMDEFCRSLKERGHEICIVCPAYPGRMNSQPNLFRTIRVPSGSGLVSKEDRLALPWREKEALLELDRFDPQVVHIQTEFSIGAMGRRYCRNRGMPILSTCHTHYELYMKAYLPLLPIGFGSLVVRAWLRAVYANDNLIITPSRCIRDVMTSYGIDKEYAIIPNGVDDRVFHPSPAEAGEFRKDLAARHPGFDKGPLIVYVGRISQEKNLGLLAEAMVFVFDKNPEARLLLVGGGPKKAEFQQIFGAHGHEDRIAWIDYMQRAKLPAIYSAADIVVFPSKTENQSLVTLEAMLCGAPAVGVNRMGTAEIMEGDIGGLLAEDDPADFAEKILRLLVDPALRAEKAAQALDHAKQWTIGTSCDRLEEVYRRLFGLG